MPIPLHGADGEAVRATGRGPGGTRARPRAERVSRRVQRGDGAGAEQSRDTVPERFDRAGRGPVEEHPIFVLFARSRPFAERAPQGGRVGSSQRRVGQRVRAEGRREARGSARQEEPHGVGQQRRCRGPVAGEVTLDRLDRVFAMPSRAVEVIIPPLGCRRRSGGDDKARLGARGQDCRCDKHAPWLGPCGSGSGARLLEAAAGGRACAMGLREGSALRGEAACLLHHGGRLAEQNRMTREAEDAIGQTAMGDPLDALGSGARTVPAHQEMRLGPVAPQRGQESDEDQRVHGAGRTLPRSEARGDQGVCRPLAHAARQGTVALVGMGIERPCLLAMRRLIGVIEGEPKGGGGRGGARHAVVDARLGEPGEVVAVSPVREP
jgi:hypothetical protein